MLLRSPDGSSVRDVPDSLVAYYRARGATPVGPAGPLGPDAATGPTESQGRQLLRAAVHSVPDVAMTAGGIAGLEAGPVGIVGGSAIARMGGKAMEGLLLRMLGFEGAPGTSVQAANQIAQGGETGALGAALGIGAGRILENPIGEQALRRLGGLLLRGARRPLEALEQVGELAAGLARRAGPVAQQAAPAAEAVAEKAAPAAEAVAEKAARATVKGTPEFRAAALKRAGTPVNPVSRGASGPALGRRAAAMTKAVTPEEPAGGLADRIADNLQKSLDLEAEMAHRNLTPSERAIARRLFRMGIDPFEGGKP